ncbi:MAG: hypothetical protein D6768_10205 [Chloroflexi bacterium]|nr:MAG: hypothetical protein D6768_10205 [Chloroflexota bacterium]
MKQFHQFTNVSLIITILVIILGLFGLSTVFAASGQQVNLLAPQVNVEATVKALQLENRESKLEDASEERIKVIKTEIDAASRSLREFEEKAATQTAQQTEQLSALQQQVIDKRATVQSVEAGILQLRQSQLKDEEAFNNNMAALNGELGSQVAELTSKLAAVNNEISNIKLELTRAGLSTPEIPGVRLSREDSLPPRISSGNSESGSSSGAVSGKRGGDSGSSDSSSDSGDDHSDDDHSDDDK